MPQAARVSRVTSDSGKRELCPTNLLSLPEGRSYRHRLYQSQFWEKGPPYQGSEHLLSALLLPPEFWVTAMHSISHLKPPRKRRFRPSFARRGRLTLCRHLLIELHKGMNILPNEPSNGPRTIDSHCDRSIGLQDIARAVKDVASFLVKTPC